MIHTKEKQYTIINQSCLDAMDEMDENSIDCIVTDPPYEIGFMGKKWDSTGIAFNVKTWEKALRVLKPGGYLLAFNHSRTFHRMMVAIEDAGFELRDTIMWLYGSGFPKSHNISKAIDKRMGVDSEVVGIKKQTGAKFKLTQELINNGGFNSTDRENFDITIPTSPEAKQWSGFGTALKPAFEPIVLARKPFKTTVAENVLTYGVGGINIDECRIDFVNEKDKGDPLRFQTNNGNGKHGIFNASKDVTSVVGDKGRFPANLILDGSDEVCSGFPDTVSSDNHWVDNKERNTKFGQIKTGSRITTYADSGSASRYFYTAKASVKDRDEGLSEFDNGIITDGREKSIDNAYNRGESIRKNIHPTVKPTELMQYLIRLVAPKGATILDIFMGSGSTGKACMIENTERNANYHFIGIDLEKEYCDIAKARIEWGINFKEIAKLESETTVFYDDDNNKTIAVQRSFDL